MKPLKICGLYEFRNWPISALSFGQEKNVPLPLDFGFGVSSKLSPLR